MNLVHTQPKYQVLDAHEIGKPESILASILAGVLSAGAVDDIYLADDDEADDMRGIRAATKRLNFNSNHGKFAPGGVRDKDVLDGDYPTEIVGVILARVEGHVLYGFDANYRERVLKFKSLGFRSLLDVPTWICSNRNMSHPLKAELNPALTPEQVDEAKKFGVGGATGRGCTGCPMAKWHKDELGADTRNCQGTEAYIWLGDDEPEPVVLSTSSSQSYTAMKRFLAEHGTVRGKPAKIYRFLIKIGTTSGKNSKKVMHPEILGEVPPSVIPFLQEYRLQAKALLERMEIVPAEAEAAPVSEAEAAEAALGGLL